MTKEEAKAIGDAITNDPECMNALKGLFDAMRACYEAEERLVNKAFGRTEDH